MGTAAADVYAGMIPAVKAWDGPLPKHVIGVEFYTDESGELVAISGVVTMRQEGD